MYTSKPSGLKNYGSPPIGKKKVYVHNVKENFVKAVESGAIISRLNTESKSAMKQTISSIKKLIAKTKEEENNINIQLMKGTNNQIGLDSLINKFNEKNSSNNKEELNLDVFKYSYKKTGSREVDDVAQIAQIEKMLAMYNISRAINGVETQSIKTFQNAVNQINKTMQDYSIDKKESSALYGSSTMKTGILFESVAGAWGQIQAEKVFKEFDSAIVETKLIGSDKKITDIERTIKIKNNITINIREDVKLSRNYTNQRIYNLEDERIHNPYVSYLVYNMLAISNVNHLWSGSDISNTIKTAVNRFINAKALQYSLVDGGVNSIQDYNPEVSILTTPYGSMRKSKFFEKVLEETEKASKSLEATGAFRQFGAVTNNINDSIQGIGLTQKNLFRIKDRKYQIAKGSVEGYKTILSDSIIGSNYFSVVADAAKKISFKLKLKLEIPKE